LPLGPRLRWQLPEQLQDVARDALRVRAQLLCHGGPQVHPELGGELVDVGRGERGNPERMTADGPDQPLDLGICLRRIRLAYEDEEDPLCGRTS
jgi:hypothetical protein